MYWTTVVIAQVFDLLVSNVTMHIESLSLRHITSSFLPSAVFLLTNCSFFVILAISHDSADV